MESSLLVFQARSVAWDAGLHSARCSRACPLQVFASLPPAWLDITGNSTAMGILGRQG